jgi:hypothetical protein
MELKVKKKIKVLLLVEVAAQEGVEPGTRLDFGGPVLEGHGGTTQWSPGIVAGEIEEVLKREFPATRYPDTLWYVKSVKEAVAP